MSADTRSDEADALELDRDEPTEPSDATFWQKYNSRLEMPTSAVISVLLHALFLAAIVGILLYALSGKDTKPVPIKLIGPGGDDDSGEGSPGSGSRDTVANATAPTQQDRDQLPRLSDLPDVKKDIQDRIAVDDPTAVAPLSDDKLAAYASLDKAVRDRLLGPQSGNPGNGIGVGKGDGDQQGAGPGGYGADSTRARSLRWVLRFRTTSGRDYLDQLRALGATVLVPIPPDNKSMYVFTPADLASPKPGRTVTEAEWGTLGAQIQFCDFKRSSAEQIGPALNLNYIPSCFWAFFPRQVEEDLSRKERGYKNKDSKDIAETVFEVAIRGGSYEFKVVEQKLKR
jgi:hypothetical protein